MSPSAEPPRFFVDRSLGAQVVPERLRRAGFAVETMRERYGEERAQTIPDVEWLADVGRSGLVVLMKDKRIRLRLRNKRRSARTASGASACLAGNLTGLEMAEAFLAVRQRILLAAAGSGPFIYQVNATGLTRVL